MIPNEHGVFTGTAISIGEQPIKSLLNPAAMGRMSVGEALTNLVWAKTTGEALEHIKCSGNWMWAAKFPGEGPMMYETCLGMVEALKDLGVAIDGGKDSLSMAAKCGEEVVKVSHDLISALLKEKREKDICLASSMDLFNGFFFQKKKEKKRIHPFATK